MIRALIRRFAFCLLDWTRSDVRPSIRRNHGRMKIRRAIALEGNTLLASVSYAAEMQMLQREERKMADDVVEFHATLVRNDLHVQDIVNNFSPYLAACPAIITIAKPPRWRVMAYNPYTRTIAVEF